MPHTVEAAIDPQGIVHLSEPVALSAPRRALVTILDEEPVSRDLTQEQGLRQGFADMDAGRTLLIDDARAEFDQLWTARFGTPTPP